MSLFLLWATRPQSCWGPLGAIGGPTSALAHQEGAAGVCLHHSPAIALGLLLTPVTLPDFPLNSCPHLASKMIGLHFLAFCLTWSVGSVGEADIIPCGACTILGAPWWWTGWMRCFLNHLAWEPGGGGQGGGCL